MIKRVGNYEALHEVVEHNGILYISGIVADDTTLGMADQTTQALTALARLLEENGSGVDRILQILDWFVPPQARTDEATLGRSRIFAFSHIFGPCLGHAISIYLYVADQQRGFPFWVIVACITAFWP